MKLQIIAVGKNQPPWVDEVFQDYAKRFTNNIQLELKEIKAAKRNQQTTTKSLLQQEAKNILAILPAKSITIALDVHGSLWSTKQLAQQLSNWQQQANIVNFLIGGPDGLDTTCLQQAQQRWSLSPLTFPHAMARIMVVEQLYRAWSILNNHPYHRAD